MVNYKKKLKIYIDKDKKMNDSTIALQNIWYGRHINSFFDLSFLEKLT